MNTYFDFHFQKNITMIHPGELYVSGADILIGTVLGSCVSVLLYDPVRHIGGMNHFMLASSGKSLSTSDQAGRYGTYAVDMLIDEMHEKGADIKKLSAKIFGGGNILSVQKHSERLGVAEQNITCAFSILESYHIPVLASETGGNQSFKLYYSPVTSKVWLRRVDAE